MLMAVPIIGSPYTPEAAAYFATFSTYPSQTFREAVDAVIRSLKDDNLFSRLQGLFCYDNDNTSEWSTNIIPGENNLVFRTGAYIFSTGTIDERLMFINRNQDASVSNMAFLKPIPITESVQVGGGAPNHWYGYRFAASTIQTQTADVEGGTLFSGFHALQENANETVTAHTGTEVQTSGVYTISTLSDISFPIATGGDGKQIIKIAGFFDEGDAVSRADVLKVATITDQFMTDMSY